MRMDYYSTLGVPRGASEDEIKKAYRKLAMTHHPDRGGDQAKFQQIQEAYATLSDPGKRQQYDNPQPQNGGFEFHFGGGGDPFQDIFAQFGFPPRGAGGGGHHFDPFQQFRQQHQQPRRNKDLRVQITVPQREIMQDQNKTISVQTTNGQRQTVDITIPRGVQNGSSIKYAGLGDNFFETLVRGDLYVVIHVEPDPRFETQDLDIIYTANINCFDAMLGQNIEIPSLDDRIFSLNIPAGTQNDALFRIPNQGVYALGTQHRGNLIVRIKVTIPTNLSEDDKQLVRQLQVNQ